jgi:hypothetical protein
MTYTLSDLIPLLQPMVTAKLNSEPFFSPIAIFAIEERDISSQVASSLAGYGGNVQGQTGKKAGATIEVLMPELSSRLPDSPGPTTIIDQKFHVKTNSTINFGASGNGVGIKPEAIAARIAQTFHKFSFGDTKHFNGFYAPDDYYRRLHPGYDNTGDLKPLVVIEVTIQAILQPDELAQTSQPTISAPEQTVTLTDTQSGGGSAIYYALGYGQFPGTGNPNAILYSAPFTVPSGTVVNVAAYNPPNVGSQVQTVTIN